MSEVQTYYQRAPYSYDTHDRVPKENVCGEMVSRLVAYEMCDGGDGRCKCATRCVWGVLKRK